MRCDRLSKTALGMRMADSLEEEIRHFLSLHSVVERLRLSDDDVAVIWELTEQRFFELVIQACREAAGAGMPANWAEMVELLCQCSSPSTAARRFISDLLNRTHRKLGKRDRMTKVDDWFEEVSTAMKVSLSVIPEIVRHQIIRRTRECFDEKLEMASSQADFSDP